MWWIFKTFCLIPTIGALWCLYNLYTVDWGASYYLWPWKLFNQFGVFVGAITVGLNLLLLPLGPRSKTT